MIVPPDGVHDTVSRLLRRQDLHQRGELDLGVFAESGVYDVRADRCEFYLGRKVYK